MFKKSNVLASQMRQVTMYWQKGGYQIYLVEEGDVKKFVQALKNLHVNPGINPNNGGEAAKAGAITIQPLELEDKFWWSSPDLKNEDAGAVIWKWGEETLLWKDKDFVLEPAQIEKIKHSG